MRKSLMLLIGLLSLVASAGGAATPPASPQGNWLTEDKGGIVQIYRCGETLCGKALWFRLDPNPPNPDALDLRNPDPAKRHQRLCGLTFMYGFKSGEDGRWKDGMIYDPHDGNTYHATITPQPDGTLDLHGYIGISLIGRSEIWTRYSQPVPPCPGR